MGSTFLFHGLPMLALAIELLRIFVYVGVIFVLRKLYVALKIYIDKNSK
jgi:hypothetical protein